MWTRAAVALRNINICEMPSHDDWARGRVRGARAVRLRPRRSARVLGWSPSGRGAWELCAAGLCPPSWLMGTRPR